jgi:hypothetical protein
MTSCDADGKEKSKRERFNFCNEKEGEIATLCSQSASCNRIEIRNYARKKVMDN